MAKQGKIIRNGIVYSGSGGCDIEYLTQAEYDALPDSKLTNGVEYRITDANTSSTVARNIAYDNSESGIEAVSVQDAIDTVNESLDTKVVYGNDNSSCKIKVYTGFSGSPKANQCVKFGNVQVPEDGTKIIALYMTPLANIVCNLHLYGYPNNDGSWSIHCESSKDINTLLYTCMVVYQ